MRENCLKKKNYKVSKGKSTDWGERRKGENGAEQKQWE